MILRMIVLLMYFITVARLLSSLYLCTLSQLVFYFPNFYLFLPDREGKGHDAGTETDINLDHQLFYHFLGTDQSEDILCWKDSEHPKWTVGSEITEDGKVGRILCVVFQIKHGILILWLYNIFFLAYNHTFLHVFAHFVYFVFLHAFVKCSQHIIMPSNPTIYESRLVHR